LPKVKGGRSYR